MNDLDCVQQISSESSRFESWMTWQIRKKQAQNIFLLSFATKNTKIEFNFNLLRNGFAN